jgi:hypothetical protein
VAACILCCILRPGFVSKITTAPWRKSESNGGVKRLTKRMRHQHAATHLQPLINKVQLRSFVT